MARKDLVAKTTDAMVWDHEKRGGVFQVRGFSEIGRMFLRLAKSIQYKFIYILTGIGSMKLAIPLILCIFLFDINYSLGQELIDPVQTSYFVIKRQSHCVSLPSDLGGKAVDGYAAVQISVNDLGKLLYTEVLAIKVKGKINLNYQQHISERTDTATQFERFLLNHVSEKIEIIKTEIPSPPKVTKIEFLIRFR